MSDAHTPSEPMPLDLTEPAASHGAPPPRSTSAPAPLAGFMASFQWGLRLAFKRKRLLAYFGVAAALGFFLGTVGVAQDNRYGNNSGEYKLHELWILIDYACVQWMLPIVAMMFVAGGYAREVNERTLVFHLVRPIRRSTLFLSRYCAGLVPGVVAALILLYSMLLGSQQDIPSAIWGLLVPFAVVAVMTLGALFYTLSALFKRGTIIGLIYVFVLEGILTSNRGSIRDLALLHHIRALGRGLFGDVFGEHSWAVREKMRTGEVSELMPTQTDGLSAAVDQLAGSPDFASTTTALMILGCITAGLLLVGIIKLAQRDYPLKD